MIRALPASLALVGLFACGRSTQEVAGADRGGRDLELAPSASGGTLSDRPVDFLSTARTLGAGARIDATVITLTGPLTVSTK